MRSVYLTPEAARLHLLEAERQRAVGEAALDRLAGQEQRRGAGRAVVVDVDDRDPGQAELVERPLAVGRVAVAVAGVGLLDVLVGDAGVGERLLPRLLGPVRVVALLGAGLLELGHPDPDHERAVAQSLLLCLAAPCAAFGWLARKSTGRRRLGRSPLATSPPGSARPGRRGRRSAMPIAVPRARWPAASRRRLAEGVGEQHRVGGDRGGEQRVLDGEQAEGEARWRWSGRARATTPSPPSHSASAVATTRPSSGADRAQDQAVVGLVRVGAQDEEDRQRDPEAVLVHAEQPVGGDAGGERGAEAERVAERWSSAG